MKFIRSCMGALALTFAGMTLAVATPQHSFAEVTAAHPATEIAVIHFRGGRLVQSAEQYGRWFEKRNNGQINYEFFETDATDQSIELTGPNGEVKLFVDLSKKVVKGQWPGQEPKVIYKITKIEKMVFVKAPSYLHEGHDDCVVTPPKPTLPCPIVPVLPPLVHPPVAQPPVAHPPVTNPGDINAHVPLPKDLRSATYLGGEFVQVGEFVWEQRTASGGVYHFKTVGYDEQALYIYDVARHTFISLEPLAKLSRISVGGDYLQQFMPLTSVTAHILTPIPPVMPIPDGAFNDTERAACEQAGGFVERAGMLGAERCTTPFADAGTVCTDSSQCDGQCRTGVNGETPVGLAGSKMDRITGVCQANDNPFGCFSEVVGGMVGPGLCVD